MISDSADESVVSGSQAGDPSPKSASHAPGVPAPPIHGILVRVGVDSLGNRTESFRLSEDWAQQTFSSSEEFVKAHIKLLRKFEAKTVTGRDIYSVLNSYSP